MVSIKLNRSILRSTQALATAAAAFIVAAAPVFSADKDATLVLTSEASLADVPNIKTDVRARKLKVGLALGGGGARGAAHAGVLEVLEKEGIKFDYIAGTSIGSVVGGLYAAGVPVKDISEDFVGGDIMKHFMTISLPTRIVLSPVLILPRVFGARPFDGLYTGNGFRKYLEKTLPTGQRKIQDLKVPFAAVALNVLDGKPYMIRGGDVGYAMQASSAVPSLRKPVEIGGKLFVDGGVACNLPVKQCREMGADIVIAVNIDQPFTEEPIDTFRKPTSIAKRMLNWDLYDIDRVQEELADIVIHPDTEKVTLISTNKNEASKLLEAGRQAAQALLPQIREKLKTTQSVTAERLENQQ